jgi:hypothetical protein
MKKHKQRPPKDRHLDTPGEANRDKHINFVALENNDPDPADIPPKRKLSERNVESENIAKRKNKKRTE